MNLIKKNKYRILKTNITNIKNNPFNIYLILHDNNSFLTNFPLSRIYTEKNIVYFIVKLNLLKKVTKNSLLLNLFSGPTFMAGFTNLETILLYCEEIEQAKKVLPLAVFFKNKFYAYPIFLKYAKVFKTSQSIELQEHQVIKNFIMNLFTSNKKLMLAMHQIFINLNRLLNIIINKKTNGNN